MVNERANIKSRDYQVLIHFLKNLTVWWSLGLSIMLLKLYIRNTYSVIMQSHNDDIHLAVDTALSRALSRTMLLGLFKEFSTTYFTKAKY